MSPSRRRRVTYVTGTRADFGLMMSTLRAIERHPSLQLDLLVTGMHLEPGYGMTVHEIEAQGFQISARLPLDMAQHTGAEMARNLALTITGIVNVLENDSPDLLLLLGDRGEMLAGAIAAIHLGIPIVHIHGGERSGTVDEPVRHAISKLAHLHLVATAQAKDRLVRMGERPDHVHLTGAPGLDGLTAMACYSRESLCQDESFDPSRPVALLVFHPVLQELEFAGRDTRRIVEALLAAGCQVVALMPNADAGSLEVREALLSVRAPGQLAVRTHLERSVFVSWMAVCDVMIGNSSSGIIEAASFGTPVINVGTRQNMRERNCNVRDVAAEPWELAGAIAQALRGQRSVPGNVYGDGHAGQRIVNWLASFELSAGLMAKCNAY